MIHLNATGRQKVSLFVPVKAGGHSETDDLYRLSHLLLPSIYKYFEPDLLAEIVVCYVDSEFVEVRNALSPLFGRLPIRLVPESELLDVDLMVWSSLGGWRKQQVLKLLSYRVCLAPYVLAADCDIIVARFCDKDSLFPDGKIAATFEGPKSHSAWWEASAKILELPPETPNGKRLGVTPCILRAGWLRELNACLSAKATDNDCSNWMEYCMKVGKDKWTEYTLYWLYAAYNHASEEYYVSSPIYKFCDIVDLEFLQSIIQFRSPTPFCVLQGTKWPIETVRALERNFLKPKERFCQNEKTFSLSDGYYRVDPRLISYMLSNVDIWQVSMGGVGSNYVAGLCGLTHPFYPETCHFPYPLPLTNKSIKGLYIYDDVFESIISQLNRKHHLNIGKISNKAYPEWFMGEMTLDEYAERGEDLMGLEKQFDSWTARTLQCGFPILCVRFSTLISHLEDFFDFFEFASHRRARIRRNFEYRPRQSVMSQLDTKTQDGLRKIYGRLDEKIRESEDFFIAGSN